MPTKQVNRGIGPSVRLEYVIDEGIDAVTFTPMGGGKSLTWKESLSANYTDGILILHKGRVVYEKYFGCLDEMGKHAAMSMTKSLTGLLAEILVVEGRLDDTAKVSSIIPELKDSGFGSATVRQVMDMTTALDYSEDYSDPKAHIWVYSKAASPLPKPKGYQGPNGYFEYLQTVKRDGVPWLDYIDGHRQGPGASIVGAYLEQNGLGAGWIYDRGCQRNTFCGWRTQCRHERHGAHWPSNA